MGTMNWHEGVTPKASDPEPPEDRTLGWQPAPDGNGMRWWTGRQWTEATSGRTDG